MSLTTLLATAGVSLAMAPSAVADTATLDLFPARDACGATDELPPAPRLSLSLGAFTGGCGPLLGLGGLYEQTYTTPLGDGVPVTLDTSRPITIAISITSDPGVGIGGIGDETVELTLTGKRGSSTVQLGTASQTTPAATMLRQTSSTYEFELPLTAAKAGTYKSLTLNLGVGGAQQSGYVDHGGGSLVSLPVFDPIEEPEA